MQKTWTAAVGVAAACLLLAGCSTTPSNTPSSSASGSAASSAPAASSTPSATASSGSASGSTITGTGYRYTVPKGWAVPKTDVGQSQTDSLAADLTDTDGFSDNINVVKVKTGAVTPEQIEAQGPQQLKSAGFTKVSVEDRVKVAGVESAHISALQGSGKYRVEQFYVIRKGEGYITTFSFSPDVSQSGRDAVADSVLGSWTWA